MLKKILNVLFYGGAIAQGGTVRTFALTLLNLNTVKTFARFCLDL